MQLKQLFIDLATRVGVTEAEAKFKAALDAMPELDIDDELVANKIKLGLITESEAENRETIKKKHVAQALNGVDAQLEPFMAEFFDPTELETLKTEKVTTKKLARLLEKAKTVKAAGGSATETAKTIADLNDEINRLKTEKTDEVTKLTTQHQRERFFDGIAAKVVSRNDVTDYAKAKGGKRVLSDFEESLAAVGGVLDVATGRIVKASDHSLEVYIDNKPVTVDGLLDKTLKDNEYIKKSEKTPSTTVAVPPTNDQPNANSAALKNLQQAREKAKQTE